MRRTRFRKQAVKPSMFPFLAVLICTMGALIVLLVVVMQQARVNAETISEQEISSDNEKIARRKEALEELDWKRELLATQRNELRANSQERRGELSHLEDHFRRLTSRLSVLNEQAERLQQLGAMSSEAKSVDLQLTALNKQIEKARRALEKARQAATSRPRSFSLIPYDGPNGTRRRPIYVECLRDRVTIQPEGVVLTSADFEGPLGPGNPLDAALRAIREHWARVGDIAISGEPYPLLVVRPGGAVSYAAARAAMQSWDDEFGYELIDENMVLAFPPADETLRTVLDRTVREARRRQELIKSAQPSRYGGSRGGFQATPRHGGFEPINPGREHGHGFSSGGSGGFGKQNASPGGQPPKEGAEQSPDSSGNALRRPASAKGAGKGAAAGAPLAEGRGKDWALPNAASGSVAFTRPIRVACFSDRLIIQRERGSIGRPIVVPLNQDTQAAVDEFVSKLWNYMESWGIAGRGAYWKPILKIKVAPGAEYRYADLETLLRNSGVELQRVSP